MAGRSARAAGGALITGKVLWRSPTRWTVLAAAPTGDQFYTTDPSGALAALNAATGKVVWSVPSAAGQLASDGRRVYVSRNGITAYDAATGKVRWRRADIAASRPIRAGGLFYVTDTVLSPVNGSTGPGGPRSGRATPARREAEHPPWTRHAAGMGREWWVEMEDVRSGDATRAGLCCAGSDGLSRCVWE